MKAREVVARWCGCHAYLICVFIVHHTRRFLTNIIKGAYHIQHAADQSPAQPHDTKSKNNDNQRCTDEPSGDTDHLLAQDDCEYQRELPRHHLQVLTPRITRLLDTGHHLLISPPPLRFHKHRLCSMIHRNSLQMLQHIAM
mmetsp:Transcript_16531/g.24520  ORF Transcript_16531/g.24520 Transcript_16531/m.24520 type:complete len:141 (-) Transcript_16531:1051-1473(-)